MCGAIFRIGSSAATGPSATTAMPTVRRNRYSLKSRKYTAVALTYVDGSVFFSVIIMVFPRQKRIKIKLNVTLQFSMVKMFQWNLVSLWCKYDKNDRLRSIG